MKPGSCLLIASLTVCLLTGCGTPADKDAVAELRAEIEQLENQLGRLEFRVYELENADRAADPEQMTEDERNESIKSPPTDADRYDLTPVE